MKTKQTEIAFLELALLTHSCNTKDGLESVIINLKEGIRQLSTLSYSEMNEVSRKFDSPIMFDEFSTAMFLKFSNITLEYFRERLFNLNISKF